MTAPEDRPLPFNTGKVRIGAHYERQFRWEPSRDAYNLQTALLEGRHLVPVRDPWLVRIGQFLVRIVLRLVRISGRGL